MPEKATTELPRTGKRRGDNATNLLDSKPLITLNESLTAAIS